MSGAHLHLQPWHLSVLVTYALVFIAFVYLRGWLRLRSASPNTISAWRLAAFIGGLSFLWIVLGSPLSALDHELLTIHMINHLVLMLVVAPLLLVGTPALALLWGLPASLGRGVQDLFLHNPAAQRLSRLLRHPVFCWLCATVVVIGWHVPAVFRLAMRCHWLHDIEYASFTLAGLLFWWPVVQPATKVPPRSRWSMPLYLFLATLPCDILSAFLVFCDRVVYPSYLSAPRLFNLSPLQDQQCAGALMWVSVTVAYLLPAAVITVKILSPHSMHLERQARGASAAPLNGSQAEVA
jgi:putative membrane protein